MDLASLGLKPPAAGQKYNDDPYFEARWHLTVFLPRLRTTDIRRFGPRWAGIRLLPLRPWVLGGPNPSSFCIVSGAVWIGGEAFDLSEMFWEYTDLDTAKSALDTWNGDDDPPNFITKGIA